MNPTAQVLCKRAPDGAWEIPILGDIGFFGTNGEDLIRELQAVKPDVVKFIIYSPGGMVYDAIAVAGWIQEKGIECYAEIYGVCASAATIFAALAGPKRTAIAPGSMFLVHMPYGGDQKAIDNAAAFCADLYVKSYGWTKAEARKHMEENDGNGVLWNTKEAKQMGVVSEIMEGAKVAARFGYEQQPVMSNSMITVKGTLVNLVATKGKEVEVLVQANAEQQELIQALETTTEERKAAEAKVQELTDSEAALKTKLDELTGKLTETEAAVKAAEEKAATELEAVTAQLTEANGKVTNLTTDLGKLKAATAGVPTAKAISLTVDGEAVDPTNEPVALSAGAKVVKAAIDQANPLQLAQAKMKAEKAQ